MIGIVIGTVAAPSTGHFAGNSLDIGYSVARCFANLSAISAAVAGQSYPGQT
jgi:hypothetical protein